MELIEKYVNGETFEEGVEALEERALKGSIDIKNADVIDIDKMLGRKLSKGVKKKSYWARYAVEMKSGAEIDITPSPKGSGKYNVSVSVARGDDLKFLGKTEKELKDIFKNPTVVARIEG